MGEVGVQTDLAAWLLACVDEDEERARAASESIPYDEGIPLGSRWTGEGGLLRGEPRPFTFKVLRGEERTVEDYAPALWDCEGSDTLCMPEEASLHAATWDPARVLAECDTKRRIIAECAPLIARQDWEYDDTPDLAEQTLRLLALPYRDRPGYREEWAPTSTGT